MPPRRASHRYVDPLDYVWVETAARIGFQVTRSDEVYAASTGAGRIVIGVAGTLDADDCLAQMIFHELCHSLVEGEEAFAQPDWGLDNTGERDVWREHACLRLQAHLSAAHQLRAVLAPTTEFRGYYDALGDDPLAPADDASARLAARAAARAAGPPWAPHLERALAATAAIAAQAAAFVPAAAAGATLPALWELVSRR